MASMEEKSKSYQKNSYEIVRLEIVSNQGGDPIDLKTHFIDITIYESIFDTKMFGEILLVDGFNYMETLPVVGNETIYISFKTTTFKKPVEIVGRVFSVVGRGRTNNEKNDVYKLQFVSIPQFENHTRRVSGSRKGSIAKIVSDIFSENFGPSVKIAIDPTDSKTFQYVFPFWSPIFTAEWLSKRAFSPINQTKFNPSTFVFYEDVDGFHFMDIVKKFNQRTRFTYRVEPPNPANQTDVNRFFEQVQEYNVANYFDRLMELNMGMHSATLVTHDITTKSLQTYDLSYNDTFKEYNHLNKYPLIPTSNRKLTDSRLSCRSFLPVQTDRNRIIDKNDDPEDFYLDSASIEKQLDTIKITAVVAGNSEIRLLDVVDLEVPKGGYLDGDEKDWKDIYLSGRHLVVSIKHTINKDVDKGYITTLELAKDSLIKGIPDVVEKKGTQNR